MPTYEYECRSCKEVIEIFQSMRDAPLVVCPRCGQPGLKRLIGRGAGIIFKGSGFYETDYKRAGSKKDSEGSSGSASSTDKPAAPSSTPPSSSGGSSSSSGSSSSPPK